MFPYSFFRTGGQKNMRRANGSSYFDFRQSAPVVCRTQFAEKAGGEWLASQSAQVTLVALRPAPHVKVKTAAWRPALATI
jgi:hypothetical protein